MKGNGIMPEQTEVKTLVIPEDLHRRLKSQASIDGKKISEVVETVLERYLENPVEVTDGQTAKQN